MASRQQTSFESIISSTSRLEFTDSEVNKLSGLLSGFAANGLDLTHHPAMVAQLDDHSREGVVVLRSEALDVDFAFVKVNAGRRLLGSRKHRIQAFVGQLLEDRFTPTASFKNFLTALAAVRGIYRTQGLLS